MNIFLSCPTVHQTFACAAAARGQKQDAWLVNMQGNKNSDRQTPTITESESESKSVTAPAVAAAAPKEVLIMMRRSVTVELRAKVAKVAPSFDDDPEMSLCVWFTHPPRRQRNVAVSWQNRAVL